MVEMGYFGGVTIKEVAEVLAVSVDTAKRDWRMPHIYANEARNLHSVSSRDAENAAKPKPLTGIMWRRKRLHACSCWRRILHAT